MIENTQEYGAAAAELELSQLRLQKRVQAGMLSPNLVKGTIEDGTTTQVHIRISTFLLKAIDEVVADLQPRIRDRSMLIRTVMERFVLSWADNKKAPELGKLLSILQAEMELRDAELETEAELVNGQRLKKLGSQLTKWIDLGEDAKARRVLLARVDLMEKFRAADPEIFRDYRRIFKQDEALTAFVDKCIKEDDYGLMAPIEDFLRPDEEQENYDD